MRLLLDTCTFLWLAAGGGALSRRAVAGIADPANDVLFSSVSAWEIVTKHQLGKLPLPEPPDRLIAEECRARGLDAFPFDQDSALHGVRLPPLHRDPFDRMLICQAIAHGLVIVTPDPLVAQYPIRVLW